MLISVSFSLLDYSIDPCFFHSVGLLCLYLFLSVCSISMLISVSFSLFSFSVDSCFFLSFGFLC